MAIRMSGLVSGMDTESIVKELMSAQRYKLTKIENKKTKLEWKQEKWKTLNSKIYSFYTGSLSKVKMEGNFNTVKATSSDESKVEVTGSGSAPEGNHSIIVKSVASTQMVTGAELATTVTGSTKLTSLMTSASGESINITVGEKTTTFNIDTSKSVSDFVSALEDAGLNASYDTTQKRFFISAKQSGSENAFSITPSSANVDLTKIGLSEISALKQADGTVSVTADSTVAVIPPSDAVITYNEADYTSSSNTITANGLTMTVKAKSNGETININVTKDTAAVYDMVKNFVKSYNELVTSMNDAYYADYAKGYEPLSDDEKEAMTDDQVTKWEDKIKNSLLRRDSTIGTLTTSMRTILGNSVSYDDKSYSLASFGITSPDYTEKGLLHIDGNSEDSLTSMNTDKLKKALTENPDAVMKTLTTLADELYDDMTDRMKSTTLRSALTFYNDKEMKNTLNDYKSEISDMEDRLDDMETRYYKQFTAMETAMEKMNSQSANLTSLLGGTSN